MMNGRVPLFRFVFRVCAWACLGCVIFFTLGPVRFRPELAPHAANADRFIGYLVLAMLFVWAYPGRMIAIAAACSILAICLELLQLPSLGRHPHVEDALFKLLGAGVGLQLGFIAEKFGALAVRSSPDSP